MGVKKRKLMSLNVSSIDVKWNTGSVLSKIGCPAGTSILITETSQFNCFQGNGKIFLLLWAM